MGCLAPLRYSFPFTLKCLYAPGWPVVQPVGRLGPFPIALSTLMSFLNLRNMSPFLRSPPQ